MPKASVPKTVYVCDNCGARYPRWQGQCGKCGEWNTLVETVEAPASVSKASKQAIQLFGSESEVMVSAAEVAEKGEGKISRLPTDLYEVDRVFGEGVVLGSVSLIGGEPGIGKSTILTQIVINILKREENSKIMYVAGEESPTQITQRIQRMIGKTAKGGADVTDILKRLLLVTTTDVDQVTALVQQERPSVLVVDSIQTTYTTDLTGIAGSVGQIRESASRFVRLAKVLQIPTFFVGHVTKEGDIAGPKVLEHIVDTVIEVSGDRSGEIRVIRSLKNRFGPTDEVGLFRLTSDGIEEISNPGELFLEESTLGQAGSALALCMEGSRPVIAEVQALVVRSFLPTPRRVVRGINVSKLHLLVAVLQRHAKINLGNDDVFVNVVGELDFKDPAIDLAVAAALISAKKEKSLGAKTVYCGEIGLLGEVRRVRQQEKRVKEAKRLGYSRVVTQGQAKHVSDLAGK